MQKVIKKELNANEIKIIAILAMTIDHLASVLFPGYPTDWWLLFIHIIGRLAAPIFWFSLVEGYHHTKNRRKYLFRLFLFAIIGHFAYNFAFGIPFLPFQTTIFNQTSVMWSLAWGFVALMIQDNSKLKSWMKVVLILVICIITFPADWSSIAVMAILQMNENRGNLKKQVIGMTAWVAIYALVYVLWINPIYGIIQLFVFLSYFIMKHYNGKPGRWKGMKWFFYFYYPFHLILLGLLRICLWGDIGVIIGK